jgi:YVTN family beta-propeller protein
VCNLESASVSVVDTSTNTVIATVGVGQNPTRIAMSPEGTRAYVINYVDGTVSVIRTADHGNIATISVGNEVSGLAVSPDGAYLYVSNGSPGQQVSIFDTNRYELQDRIALANDGLTHALALAPGGLLACVVLDQSVAVVTLRGLEDVESIAMPDVPVEVLIHPDSVRAYVSCTNAGSDGAVVEIDLTTKTITRQVSTPTPGNLALTGDGRTLYVINTDPMTVSEYSTWYVGGNVGG